MLRIGGVSLQRVQIYQLNRGRETKSERTGHMEQWTEVYANTSVTPRAALLVKSGRIIYFTSCGGRAE